MKYKLLCKMTAAAVGASLFVSAALAGSDTFNRANLGGNWVSVGGKIHIVNDQAVGKASPSLDYFKGSVNDTAVSAVVFVDGTDLQYGAIALGNIAGGSNAFVKIQSQDGGGTFDHAGFYTGDNAGSDFFALSSPVPSPAVMDVFFCGTTATLRITSSAGIQIYSFDYGTSFGAGGGLGTYGTTAIDNYVGFKSACGDVPAYAHPAIELRRDTDLSLR